MRPGIYSHIFGYDELFLTKYLWAKENKIGPAPLQKQISDTFMMMKNAIHGLLASMFFVLTGCAASAAMGGQPQREVRAVVQGDSIVVTWQRMKGEGRRTAFVVKRNGRAVTPKALRGTYRYVDRTRRGIIRRGCLLMPEDVTYSVTGGKYSGSTVVRGKVNEP